MNTHESHTDTGSTDLVSCGSDSVLWSILSTGQWGPTRATGGILIGNVHPPVCQQGENREETSHWLFPATHDCSYPHPIITHTHSHRLTTHTPLISHPPPTDRLLGTPQSMTTHHPHPQSLVTHHPLISFITHTLLTVHSSPTSHSLVSHPSTNHLSPLHLSDLSPPTEHSSPKLHSQITYPPLITHL